MEGTSGAADLGPLRGGTGDAALGGTAEGASQEAPPHQAQRRSLQPAGPRFHDERCPSGSGWGKTLLRSPARATSEERPPSKRGAPLAREDSTGDPSARRRPIQGVRKRALKGRRRTGEVSPPVVGAGAVIVTRGFGRACRCGLRASRKRGRRAARASARSSCPGRGSGGRAGVLAGCGGCRSRRAALGPDRKVTGLAPSSRSREHRERSGAGSRVAVAKATSTRAATPVAGSS